MFIICVEFNGKCFSYVVVYNGVVYVIGQVVVDCSVDVVGQIWQVLVCIDELLVVVGIDRLNILFVQIWLKYCVQDFVVMNVVWDVWIFEDVLLVCVMVEVNMVVENILVEIVCQVVVV